VETVEVVETAVTAADPFDDAFIEPEETEEPTAEVAPEVQPVAQEITPAPQVEEPQPAREDSPGFLVELAGAGHKVRVPSGFDADELRRLLRALS